MSHVSPIGPDELILDDSHWRSFKDESLSSGFGTGFEPRDWQADAYGSVAEPIPKEILIPRSEWNDRIEEKERKDTTTKAICDYKGMWFKSQGSLPYCWIFCVAHAVEILRMIQGQQMVKLSPSSVGGPVTNYVRRGGWPTRGLQYVIEHGFVPESMWPATAVDRKYDTPATRAERKKYSVPEWYDFPRNLSKRERFDYVASLCLRNIPCPVAHMDIRHAMLAVDLVRLDNGRYALRERNSWGSHRSIMIVDETRGVDEACAPRVATAA